MLKEKKDKIDTLKKDLDRAKKGEKKSSKHTEEWRKCMVQLRLLQEKRLSLEKGRVRAGRTAGESLLQRERQGCHPLHTDSLQ